MEKTISGLRTVPPRWNPTRPGRLLQGCGRAWRLSPTALPARPASGEARPTALPGVCPRPGRGASRCVCRRVGGWNSHAALNRPGGARGSQGVGATEGAEQRRRPSPGRFSSWGRSGRADAPSAEVGGAEKHLSPVGTQEGLRVARGFAQRLQPLSDLRDNGGFTSTRPWTLLPGLEFRHRQALEVAEPSDSRIRRPWAGLCDRGQAGGVTVGAAADGAVCVPPRWGRGGSPSAEAGLVTVRATWTPSVPRLPCPREALVPRC